MPFRWQYCPVMRMARAGQQTGVFARVFSKNTPSDASRSMCGVETLVSPEQLIACARI